MRLSVNIDHIATIRQARQADEPDPVTAAAIAELAGADGITVHLRGDRRHIQDRDIELLRKMVRTKLNMEMGLSMEMVKTALKYKPDMCTLVPESNDEVTTSGGLDIQLFSEKISEVAGHLKAANIQVSIFIDPHVDQVKATHRLGLNTIEINTGEYAIQSRTSFANLELDKIQKAALYAKKLNFRVLAGHGLTYQNIAPISRIGEIEELNIGHSIIANAAFIGLKEAVERMKRLLK